MSRKKKDILNLRYYEIPQGDTALILYGDSWVRLYGHDETNLHFHNLLEIGICHYGEGAVMFEQEKKLYCNGQITIIPANYPHTTYSHGEEANFWEYIFVDPETIIKILFPDNSIYQKKVLEAINKKPIFLAREYETTFRKIILQIIEEERLQKPLYKKKIIAHLMELFLEIIRLYSELIQKSEEKIQWSNMPQIADVLDYINENYERELRVQELADICSMSETYFRKIFREYINMSPMDYVNLIRVQKACELMKKSNDSMEMVACKCGFITTSTFNRNFKKFLDISPYQWKIHSENYENKLLNFKISVLKGW